MCSDQNIFGLGYGSALQLGYKYAVRKNYRYVIQMDADGQHDVCNIPMIYRKLKASDTDGECPDIVLASRFMEGSSEFPVSAVKKFAFWLFRSMIYMITGRVIADPTTGLQGLGRDAFAIIPVTIILITAIPMQIWCCRCCCLSFGWRKYRQ